MCVFTLAAGDTERTLTVVTRLSVHNWLPKHPHFLPGSFASSPGQQSSREGRSQQTLLLPGRNRLCPQEEQHRGGMGNVATGVVGTTLLKVGGACREPHPLSHPFWGCSFSPQQDLLASCQVTAFETPHGGSSVCALGSIGTPTVSKDTGGEDAYAPCAASRAASGRPAPKGEHHAKQGALEG